MNLDERITIDITKDNNFERVKKNIDVALNAFFADHPEIFYINDKYEISMINLLAVKTVNLNLTYISEDKQEINTMKDELNRAVETINSKLKDNMTDYEKELLIHDLIASEVIYYKCDDYTQIPTIKHTAYAALVEKSAVCDGITKAFQIILDKNNIESIFVTGISENVPHAWCKVKIDNDYYNVDVTSDKALNSENKKLVIHSYFNVTDAELSSTHQFDNYDSVPKSVKNKYDYYEYNDYKLTYMDSFEYKLSEIAKSQSSKGLIEFKATGINDVPTKMIEALYNINFNNYKTKNITSIEYNKINDIYIVEK